MRVRIAGAGDAAVKDAVAISALLLDFNGKGLDAEVLAQRSWQMRQRL